MDPFHSVLTQDTPVNVDLVFKSEVLAVVPDTTPDLTEHSNISLMDLPNEILLNLCEYLNDELFALARVCRRLHYLALPLYFARKGMSPFSGELVLFNDWSTDILRGLAIALFKPIFNSAYYSFDSLKPLTELSQVRWAVERTSKIKELHIDSINMRHTLGFHTEVCHMVFEDILDAALDRGCETLTVCVRGWEGAYTQDLLRAFERVVNGDASLLKLFSLPTKTPARSVVGRFLKYLTRPLTRIGLMGPKQRALRVFNLHSQMLFQVGICSWTIHVLNTSQITTLSLRDIDLTAKAWGIIIPEIHVPSLRDFSVDTCTIGDYDLFDFLVRHPKITHLRLGRYLRCIHLQEPPERLLPSLTHLAATPVHVVSLLQHKTLLPDLTSICLIVRNAAKVELNLVQLGNILLNVDGRLMGIKLSLEVSCEHPNAPWSRQLYAPSDAEHGTEPLFKNPLLQLSSIHLRLAFYSTPNDVVYTWPGWFRLFPELASINFTTLSKDGPTEPSRRFQFLSSLFDRCLKLQNVEINGTLTERPSS